MRECIVSDGCHALYFLKSETNTIIIIKDAIHINPLFRSKKFHFSSSLVKRGSLEDIVKGIVHFISHLSEQIIIKCGALTMQKVPYGSAWGTDIRPRGDICLKTNTI